MKIDAITGLAVAFAGFAAWHTLKPKTAAPAGQTGADIAFGQAAKQRHDVGANLWQNNVGWLTLTPAELASYGIYQNELKAQNIL